MDKFMEIKPGGRRVPYNEAYHRAHPHLRLTDADGNDWREPAAEQDPDEDLAALHWRTLQKRVQEAGGKWQGKAEAIAFLSEVAA